MHFHRADTYIWYQLNTNDANTAAWKIYLRAVFDAVAHNEPLYFHCGVGADRTGTVAVVLLGLLGVSVGDIEKDYELTSFVTGTGSGIRSRNMILDSFIPSIKAKDGDTIQDKLATFCAELGFTADEINAFRTAMIDGTPQTLKPSIGEYTVAQTLEDVTADNSDTVAVQYQPYECDITPEKGHIISDVTVTMGGKDVTALVWNGAETNHRFFITKNLEGVALSNNRNYVIAGQSYAAEVSIGSLYSLDETKITVTMDGEDVTATAWRPWLFAITKNIEGASLSNDQNWVVSGESFATNVVADSGYQISEVTITMGGTNVSTYYKRGTIAIPNVTGDIEITIKATQQIVTYANVLDTSASQLNTRYSMSGDSAQTGVLITTNGYFVTNPIAVDLSIPTSVTLVNFASLKVGSLNTNSFILFYDKDDNYIASSYAMIISSNTSSNTCKFTVDGDDLIATLPDNLSSGLTAAAGNAAYVRFSIQHQSSSLSASNLDGLEIIMPVVDVE